MNCPPGTILNPRTLRCVKADGKIAQELYAVGNISPQTYQMAQAQLYYQQPQARPQMYPAAVARPCPPGQERNPKTGRCIKIGGETYKALHPPSPRPALVPAERVEKLVPKTVAVPPPAPVAAPLVPPQVRRATTEEARKLPVGSAVAVPLGEHPAMARWVDANCKNKADPITKETFQTIDTEALQHVIRLHDRTCIISPGLSNHIATQHRAGNVATMPHDPATHLTLDDFKALREAMRRTQPGYKIPARRHQPPPPEWQLYVASDNRSGPDFASVLFVDVTKARATPTGYEYPVESVMVDLGFIPLDVKGAVICSPTMVVELIQRLSQANRLLAPVAGGWKPVGGFPFTKRYWDSERTERFNRLCRELTKALTTPF